MPDTRHAITDSGLLAGFEQGSADWGRISGPGPLSIAAEGGRLVCGSGVGTIELSAFAPGIFRLRVRSTNPKPHYGILAAAPEATDAEAVVEGGAGRLANGPDVLSVDAETGYLALERDGQAVFGSADDGHFARPSRLPALARVGGAWILSFRLGSRTKVYGLGEKWGSLDRRGQRIVSWNEDALGVNAERSYKNAPFAWSPDGWGLFVHTPARVTHGVGYAPWSHRAYVLVVEDEGLDLFLLAGADGAALLERYTHLTGRTPMPPEWSFGIWLSRAYYRTPEEMLETAGEAREAGVPADVITLDGRAWQDTATRFAFEWDAARFPDPGAVADAVHALDLRLCVWEYPLVSSANPLFAAMEAKGWLLTDVEGAAYRYRFDLEPFGQVLTPLPESGLVDFTHPDAYAWWRDRHQDLFDVGVDCIKSDFGEQVPADAHAANGDDGARLHNVYALLYNRCVFEASRHARGEAIVFGRSGWAGSQRYPIQWGGDPQADWEGLAASIRGGLSWGLSGAPCYATDIGGFYGGDPEPELYLRWTQVAVFASHMRFHGIGRREPHLVTGEIRDLVRAACRLRYRMIPYLRGAVAEAGRSGLPVMRAMPLACPDDPLAWAFDLPYVLGSDILVVPVVEPGGRAVYYLPEGDWFDFWTGAACRGGRLVDETVPLDRIPVLVRAGTVLALGPEVQHTGEYGHRPRIEEIRVYGAAERAPCLAEPVVTVAGGVVAEVPEGARVTIIGEG